MGVETEFKRLVDIMDELREKCPWDRKQTIQTLRQLTIEETYELADAITESDWNGIREEIGDLMLHMVFYSRIASEERKFTLQEVLTAICEKLIRRHPHIYGDVEANDEEQVKQNWEKLKLKEGNKSVLSGVPASLPALVKSMRIQEKARGAGFDWDEKEQVWEKVQEELQEFKANFNIETGEAIDQTEAEGTPATRDFAADPPEPYDQHRAAPQLGADTEHARRGTVDRARLIDVERDARGLAGVDVDDDDVGQFLLRDRSRHGGADVARAPDDGDFAIHWVSSMCPAPRRAAPPQWCSPRTCPSRSSDRKIACSNR